MQFLAENDFNKLILYIQYYSNFLLIWFISPIVLIAIGLFYSYKENNFLLLNSKQNNYNQDKKTIKNKLFSTIEIIFFIVFVGIYIYLILYQEDFAYHDNSQFTSASLQGKFFDMPIWKDAGRFWPLGLQEYNIISLFSKTIFAYHLFSIIQLLITIVSIFFILEKINLTYKLSIIVLIMLTPSFVISFFGLIFPERNLIFWLAIFILCYQKFLHSKATIYFCGVLIATQFLLYYKEPIFLLIISFAFIRLILILSIHKSAYNFAQFLTFIKSNWLDFSLLILSIIFFLQYLTITKDKVTSPYVSDGKNLKWLSTFFDYTSINLILGTFLVVFLIRILFLFLRKKSPDLIWDCLAIANLIYFCAYLKLNIFSWYYLALVDFFAILYLARLTYFLFLSKRQKYQIVVVIILITAILLQNIHYSAYAILSRKKSIDSKVEISKFIENYLNNSNKSENINLLFPANSGYEVMEFSAFLNYKKFNVLIDSKPSKKKKNLLIMNITEQNTDNLCVSFRQFNCYNNDNPKLNDLIIFMPNGVMVFDAKLKENDSFPIDKIKEFESNFMQTFHYQPTFEGIEKILLFFSGDNLIDKKWLNAYIFSPSIVKKK